MTKKRGVVLAMALIGVAVVGANVLPSAAQQPPPPIATELLTGRAVFTDDVNLKIRIKDRVKPHGSRWIVVKSKDPSRTLVARFTVQPGAQFPWHSHPGPVIVNVTKGELVYVPADDCSKRAYPAGTAFVDPGHGHVHSAFNPTDEETVLVATFYEAPAEGPLLIPAEAPADCDLEDGDNRDH
jgi:quercetin dioxygenase-like cupin family protein